MTGVALPLVALVTLQASTFEVGVVSAAGVAAWLVFGLAAGVWVDRLPKRRMLVGCDALRGIALVSVPLAAAAGLLGMPHLVLVAFLVGVGSVFYDIAFQTYVPVVVESPHLITANSRLQGSESVAQVGGPSLAGAVVQVLGAPVTLLVDVASYVVSSATLLAIRTEEPPAERTGAPRMLGQIREGLDYLVRDPVLRPLALSAAALNMFGVALETLSIVFLVRTLGVPAGLVGVLLAAGGLGGVLGAVSAGVLGRRLGGARALKLAVVAGPLLTLLVPLSEPGAGLWLFAAGTGAIATFTVVFSVIARTYRQIVTPPFLLGRVTATNRFISWGVLPFGALAAGALGEVLGNRPALWVVCVAYLLTPLPVLASPLRRARDLPTEGPGTARPAPAGGEPGEPEVRP